MDGSTAYVLAASVTEAPVAPARALTTGARDLWRGVLQQLPLVLTALVVLALFFLLAWLVRRLVRRTLLKTTDRSPSFANVMGSVARAVTLLAGFLIAATIAFPGVNAGSLIAGLGVSTVAIGFAFQDILQNTLAGLLLLFRQPFRQGDQIEVNDYVGTVEAITVRETRLKTYDGRRVLIPNKDVYTNAITVQTAFDAIRSSLIVGVDYGSDLAAARQVALDAIRGVEGVLAEPAPEAYYQLLNTSTVDLDVRFWTGSKQAELRAVLDRAVEAVKDAFDAADLPLPADIVEVEARQTLQDALAADRS